MKLRNKKTGEIWDIGKVLTNDFPCWETLEQLVEDWEDYKEPKDKHYWYIDFTPEIGAYRTKDVGSDIDNRLKLIGNYFETKEEADKAVEKLKAWKRLKDAGFEITGWCNSIGDDYYKSSQIVIELNNKPDFDEYDNIEPFKADLDLLFGSDEE